MCVFVSIVCLWDFQILKNMQMYESRLQISPNCLRLIRLCCGIWKMERKMPPPASGRPLLPFSRSRLDPAQTSQRGLIGSTESLTRALYKSTKQNDVWRLNIPPGFWRTVEAEAAACEKDLRMMHSPAAQTQGALPDCCCSHYYIRLQSVRPPQLSPSSWRVCV